MARDAHRRGETAVTVLRGCVDNGCGGFDERLTGDERSEGRGGCGVNQKFGELAAGLEGGVRRVDRELLEAESPCPPITAASTDPVQQRMKLRGRSACQYRATDKC